MTERFNDPTKFPLESDVKIVTRRADNSLEVKIMSSQKHLSYHGTLVCPPDTAMHTWLLSLSGPLRPGESKLIGVVPPDKKDLNPDPPPRRWF